MKNFNNFNNKNNNKIYPENNNYSNINNFKNIDIQQQNHIKGRIIREEKTSSII